MKFCFKKELTMNGKKRTETFTIILIQNVFDHHF